MYIYIYIHTRTPIPRCPHVLSITCLHRIIGQSVEIPVVEIYYPNSFGSKAQIAENKIGISHQISHRTSLIRHDRTIVIHPTD